MPIIGRVIHKSIASYLKVDLRSFDRAVERLFYYLSRVNTIVNSWLLAIDAVVTNEFVLKF